MLLVLVAAARLHIEQRSETFPSSGTFFQNFSLPPLVPASWEGSKGEKKKKKTSGYRIALIQTASQTERQLSSTSLTLQRRVKTNGNNPAAGSN